MLSLWSRDDENNFSQRWVRSEDDEKLFSTHPFPGPGLQYPTLVLLYIQSIPAARKCCYNTVEADESDSVAFGREMVINK